MFQIQPIRSRELQEQIAEALGTAYLPDTYAFFAGELSEDSTTITSLIALCQFTFGPEKSVIRSLAYPPAVAGDEALKILIRTVMFSVYRGEIPTIVFADGVAEPAFMRSLGFRERDGEWSLDLVKFYESPCHFQPDEKKDGE